MVYPPASFSLTNINNTVQLYKSAYTKGLLSSAINVYKAGILMRFYCGHQDVHWMSAFQYDVCFPVIEKSHSGKKKKDYKLKGVLYPNLIFAVQ